MDIKFTYDLNDHTFNNILVNHLNQEYKIQPLKDNDKHEIDSVFRRNIYCRLLCDNNITLFEIINKFNTNNSYYLYLYDVGDDYYLISCTYSYINYGESVKLITFLIDSFDDVIKFIKYIVDNFDYIKYKRIGNFIKETLNLK